MISTLTTVPPVGCKLTGGLCYGKILLLSYFAIFTIFPHTKKMAAHLSSQNRGTENSSQNHSGANYNVTQTEHETIGFALVRRGMIGVNKIGYVV